MPKGPIPRADLDTSVSVLDYNLYTRTLACRARGTEKVTGRFQKRKLAVQRDRDLQNQTNPQWNGLLGTAG
jgi:hypothetical protein